MWNDEEIYQEERYQECCLIWQCPQCGWKYEDLPGYNEATPCPNCNCLTENVGESYRV